MERQATSLNSKNDSCGRIYLYDNVKFLAIILVVVGHAIDFLTRQDGNWAEKGLFFVIYSVHMPLFIFISGLFLKPMNKSTPFPKQKFFAYIFIGIILRIFMSVWKLILQENPAYSILDMYDSFTWYMGAMAVFIAVAWLFRNYNSKILLIIFTVIGCMAGYDKFIGDKLVLMRIFVFLPIFFLGYCLKPEQLLNIFSKTWLKILSVIVVVVIVCVLFFYHDIYSYLRPMFTGRNDFNCLGDYYKFGGIVRLFCYIISGVFGFSVMCLMPNKKIKFFTAFGTKTLQIYFWHKFFLVGFEAFNVYGRIASFTGETLATAIYILIVVAITYICCLNIFSFPTKQLLAFGKQKE